MPQRSQDSLSVLCKVLLSGPQEGGGRMQQSQMLCPTAPGAASGDQDVFRW